MSCFSLNKYIVGAEPEWGGGGGVGYNGSRYEYTLLKKIKGT